MQYRCGRKSPPLEDSSGMYSRPLDYIGSDGIGGHYGHASLEGLMKDVAG